MRTIRTAAGAAVMAVAIAGCGDDRADPARGYTKAPLEEPGVFVSPEPRTVMDELGEPDRLALPRAEEPDDGEEATAND